VVTADAGPGDAGVDEGVPAPGRKARRKGAWPTFRDWLIGLRASRSYAFVLLLVVIAFVFAATAPDERWATGVLVLIQSLALLIALWTSRAGPVGLRIAIPAVAAAVALAELVHEDQALSSASGVLGGLLVAATIVVIIHGVASHYEVNAQSVIGAVTVYILLGMLFVFVYTVVAVIGDGPLFAQGTDGTISLRLYFSFSTLTTVGYGDYTTASSAGHTLAVSEALVGQVYLVTVVAVLVSRMRPRRKSGGGAEVS
jgi:Ion channel